MELGLANGRRFRIGSDEPDVLRGAINARHPLPPIAAPDDDLAAPTGTWMLAPAVILGVAGIVVACAVIVSGQRPVSVVVDHGQLSVRGAGFSARVPVDQIREVRLLDAMPPIQRKVGGYAFNDRLGGHFDVAGDGLCHVFVDRDTPPFVVVRAATGTIIVNRRFAGDTRRLNDELARALGG